MLRIGKKIFSWNSVKFRMANVASEKIRSIDWDQKITDELVYGARRDGTPLGVTSGKYEPGIAKLKMLVDEWFGTGVLVGGYLSLLTLGKTVGLADVEFDIQLQFFEEVVSATPGSSGGVITIYFPTCRLVGNTQSLSESTGASEVDLAIRVIDPPKTNGAQLPSLLRSVTV